MVQYEKIESPFLNIISPLSIMGISYGLIITGNSFFIKNNAIKQFFFFITTGVILISFCILLYRFFRIFTWADQHKINGKIEYIKFYETYFCSKSRHWSFGSYQNHYLKIDYSLIVYSKIQYHVFKQKYVLTIIYHSLTQEMIKKISIPITGYDNTLFIYLQNQNKFYLQ